MTALIDLRPGMVFARDFKVERPLSEGGMGAVYVVEQVSTGKHRALKVMHPRLVTDARSRERFDQEARIGAQIDSENVVEVVAAGVDEATGTPWLAMELLDGEDLASALAHRGSFSPSDTREVMDQLCDALGRAHARGIIHRDLKPENIFLATPRRRGVPFVVKILDFGIARMVQDSAAGATATSAIGSPLWMAPEQAAAGTKHRPATDVWALGLVTFNLLTGKKFWSAANVPAESFNLQALFVEVMVHAIPLATVRGSELGVGASIPPGFDDWFARCVHRDPEQRFVHATAAFNALAPLLGGAAFASSKGYVETQALAAAPIPLPTPPVSVPRTVAMPAGGPMSPMALAATELAQGAVSGIPMGLPMLTTREPPPRGKAIWLVGGAAALVAVVAGAAGIYALQGHSSAASSTSDPGRASGMPAVADAGLVAQQPTAVPAAPRLVERDRDHDRERERTPTGVLPERPTGDPTPGIQPPAAFRPPNLNALTEPELGAYAAQLQQAGNGTAADEAMRAYLRRFPTGPRAPWFQRVDRASAPRP